MFAVGAETQTRHRVLVPFKTQHFLSSLGIKNVYYCGLGHTIVELRIDNLACGKPLSIGAEGNRAAFLKDKVHLARYWIPDRRFFSSWTYPRIRGGGYAFGIRTEDNVGNSLRVVFESEEFLAGDSVANCDVVVKAPRGQPLSIGTKGHFRNRLRVALVRPNRFTCLDVPDLDDSLGVTIDPYGASRG